MWKTVIIKGEETSYKINEKGKVKNKKGQILHNRVKVQDGLEMLVCSLQFKGETFPARVVRLVADAFIPNPNNYKFTRLKDGSVKNINLDNIEWVECGIDTGNMSKKSWASGKWDKKLSCENASAAKLTNEQVLYIKRAHIKRDPHFGTTALANEFGVSPSTISGIIHGKSWKRLEKVIGEV
jgi:hypothetical protein